MTEPLAQQSEGQDLTPLTIPVRVDIDAEQVVLNQPEMAKLLDAAERIAVGDCNCRKTAGNCDRPLEVCLGLDEEAQENIDRNGWRGIGVGEALALLERTHRAGLVHLAFRRSDGRVNLVCSCCACCCAFLGSLTHRTYRDALTASADVAEHDAAVCSACGVCVDRCPFEAFSRQSGKESVGFDADRCFGCGLCVSTCPTGAISFVARG